MSDGTDTITHLPTPQELAAEADALVHRAVHLNVRIATAESCTGGLVSHLLTDVPGASTMFLGGWVVYANDRKMALGVPEALFVEHGAVSAPVARSLAACAREQSGAELGVATTGIAGPSGGSETKPVGTVFIGVSSSEATTAHHIRVQGGDRAAKKRAFALRALQLLGQEVDAMATRRTTDI